MKTGIKLALLTATISGFSIFYNKIVVVKGIDPLIFNILKNGGTAVLLSLLLLPSKTLLMSLTKRQWTKLFLIGSIGGSIPFVLFFEGLRTVPAVQANLLNKTLFLWVALLAIPILKEKMNRMHLIGYLGITAATFVLSGPVKFTGTRGELFILGAAMLWAVEVILAKWTLHDLPPVIVAWGRMAIGTCILLVLAASQSKTHLLFSLSPSMFLPIGGSILLLTAYVTSWHYALAKLPATLGTAILAIAPMVTTLLSALTITHSLSSADLLPSLVYAGALYLLLSASRPKTTSINPFDTPV